MDFIGRVAYSNGDCVDILDYNNETKQSQIRRLSLPNEPVNAEHQASFGVKFSSLQFDTFISFAKRFPAAVALQGSYTPLSTLSEGSLLDFSNCVSLDVDVTNPEPFSVESSCRFFGKKCVNENGFMQQPQTCMPVPVQVWVKVNDVVEFEDLNFTSSEPVGFHCFAGKNIFFRRCSFSSQDIAMRIGHGNRTGKTNGALKVTFEKCTFLACDQFGLTVDTGGQVLLFDCSFTDCGTGLSVLHGGKVVAKHCDFTDCDRSVMISGRGSSGEFLNCSFSRSLENGIIISNGASFSASGCRVADCQSIGIVFEGPKRTFGLLKNCVVATCKKSAIYIRDGKIDVILTSSKFTENHNGIITQWNVVGYVDINDCIFFKNVMTDKELWNGPRCAVMENSVLLPSQSLDRIKTAIRKNMASRDLVDSRLCKNAGVATIECFYCQMTEPDDIMFKKCGRCADACYCSKECQV